MQSGSYMELQQVKTDLQIVEHHKRCMPVKYQLGAARYSEDNKWYRYWFHSIIQVNLQFCQCLVREKKYSISKKRVSAVACENIHFSLLFATGDVSCRETSVTQGQKFHTDDANQCLQNKSGSQVASHADVLRAPDINLSNFTCLLVDFGKVLCSSTNKLQQNSNASSRGDYIPQILTVLLEILLVYIWPLLPFVFFCHSLTITRTM